MLLKNTIIVQYNILKIIHNIYIYIFFQYSQKVRHWFLIPTCKGSSPFTGMENKQIILNKKNFKESFVIRHLNVLLKYNEFDPGSE